MSVLDQLRGLEKQVQQRLRELRPLVAEYRDLEKVAERLGLKREEPEATDVPAAKSAPRAKRKPKPSRSRKPAAPKPRASKPTATAQTAKPSRKPKSTPSAGARGAGAGGRPSARRRTAAPGQRQQDVLRLVRERPGITVAELAGELSVDATGLYGVVRRLQSKGQIRKDGTRLQSVDEPTPTSDASGTRSAESASASPTAAAQPRPEGPEAPATES